MQAISRTVTTSGTTYHPFGMPKPIVSRREVGEVMKSAAKEWLEFMDRNRVPFDDEIDPADTELFERERDEDGR